MVDVKKVRESIAGWLDELSEGLEPGRFRFCKQGDMVPVTGKQAQVSTCFALKIAWQAGIWDEWPEKKKQACIKFIQSFQREDGFFFDPWLAEASKGMGWKDLALVLLGRMKWDSIKERQIRNLRAETRQSAATLLMVGARLKYPLPCEINSADEAVRYIKSFDWTEPWAAGSHLSHQMFFLTLNYKLFGIPENYSDIMETVLGELDKLRDEETGSWFKGNPPAHIKVNGAMKIFSGLQWLDYPYPDCTRLMDFALSQPFQCDGCGFLNRLFVVHEAQKGVPSGYRDEDIKKLAQAVLVEVQKFQKPLRGHSTAEHLPGKCLKTSGTLNW
jgi:hypothetical protein